MNKFLVCAVLILVVVHCVMSKEDSEVTSPTLQSPSKSNQIIQASAPSVAPGSVLVLLVITLVPALIYKLV
ncbi:hypothetical protein AGOR_G00121000 [Albula goreensis]|uniref:Uncharacterized protein n=1 Tax=Albula goreensis TaxID=1534307 RepID=A0A8T3DFG3_9TELE|nr:hypothetical protein AGOR_G00121000 [Albula goreensis]